MRIFLLFLLTAVLGLPVHAQRDLVEVTQGLNNYTTMVSALKSAGLVDDLRTGGPLTVLAPTDQAFEQLSASERNALFESGNEKALGRLLTYHVLPGLYTAGDILKAVRANSNRATFKTMEGGALTATIRGDALYFIDEQGRESKWISTDHRASNGTLHALDAVLMPAD